MEIKIAEQPSAPTPAPDKVVTIESKNATLDKLTGSTPETKIEEKTEAEATAGQPEVKTEGKEGSVETQVNDSNTPESGIKKTEAPVETQVEQEEPLNLEEYFYEVNGEELALSQIVTERNALKEKFDLITKDQFLTDFIDHYLATGNANAYLDAKGVDYDKRGDLELVKERFETENADLDESTRKLLWKRELTEKYKIKPDLTEEEMQSEEYQIGQGLLKRDAKKVRGELKENQKKFQIVDRKKEENQQREFDPVAYKQSILKEKEVEAFTKNKLLKLGITDGSYAFEPKNPDQLIEMMADDRQFYATFADLKTGKVDREKQMRILAFAQDPDGYNQKLVDFGKTLAQESRLKEERNTDGRLNRQTTEGTTRETSESKAILNKMLQAKK